MNEEIQECGIDAALNAGADHRHQFGTRLCAGRPHLVATRLANEYKLEFISERRKPGHGLRR
jgi:hypothetical protein